MDNKVAVVSTAIKGIVEEATDKAVAGVVVPNTDTVAAAEGTTRIIREAAVGTGEGVPEVFRITMVASKSRFEASAVAKAPMGTRKLINLLVDFKLGAYFARAGHHNWAEASYFAAEIAVSLSPYDITETRWADSSKPRDLFVVVQYFIKIAAIYLNHGLKIKVKVTNYFQHLP